VLLGARFGKRIRRRKAKGMGSRRCKVCGALYKSREGMGQVMCTHCTYRLAEGVDPSTIPSVMKRDKEPSAKPHRRSLMANSRKAKQKSIKEYRQRRKQRGSFYDEPRWLQLRYDVLKHYGRVCMLCRETSGQMHVDHIIPRSKRPDLEFDFNNLQVLCRDCNIGKSDRDSTDFRPAA
jgi:5-methylcytosine-specific restriction endonuclease McrA